MTCSAVRDFPCEQRVVVGRRWNGERPWPRSSWMRPADVEAPSAFSSKNRRRNTRNMRSVGLNLDRWVKKGLLRIHAARPTLMRARVPPRDHAREVDETEPSVVVVDPLSSFSGASLDEVSSMVMRLIDYLRGRASPACSHTSFPAAAAPQDRSRRLVLDRHLDPAAQLTPGEQGGRHLSILKSRGMPHSSERRSFELSDDGPVVQTRARRSPTRRGQA